MPIYGDWIEATDPGSVQAGVSQWTSRWRRYVETAHNLAETTETAWDSGAAGFDDTWPYTLPAVSGQVRASQTFVQLVNLGELGNPEGYFSLSEWDPTLFRFSLPESHTLKNPLGYRVVYDGVPTVAAQIPEEDWPEGAVGYEYESDYAAWQTQPLLELRPCYATFDTNVGELNADHPSRMMLAPEAYANSDTPDASMFPLRTDFALWPEIWSGVPPVSSSGITSTIATTYEVPDTRNSLVFFLAPDYVFSESDIRPGKMGLSMGYTLRREYLLPRHRFLFSGGGLWEPRSIPPHAGNSGGWPNRSIKNGGRTGSWPLRSV